MTIAFISKTFIEKVWYSKNIVSVLLIPLSWIYVSFIRLRSLLYTSGFFSITKINAPVIIVGNIVVGGSGKTPLVIWLSKYFKKKGFSPGVVSRGYGGAYKSHTEFVKPTSDPFLVGDEPVLIARNTYCPVVVAKKRAKAAKELVEKHKCNIIISDDGIQHYSLDRDIEIVVVDGERTFGNSYCLPAGPCREPKTRPFFEANFIVNTFRGCKEISNSGLINQLELTYNRMGLAPKPITIMRYNYKELSSVTTPSKTLSASDLQGKPVHAVAGIHDPTHFFTYLRNQKLDLIIHHFPDHHNFTEKDIKFNDNLPVVMTEKDAVKCLKFSDSRHWYMPVKAELDELFANTLDNYMEKILNG